ncbi:MULTISPECIES: hypothetical protein [Pseudoalteromonas]|uniref:hypothetical protein n=1 Tax=Pseudoalteromonas TaxID=53246 RepID=UPI001EF5F2C7|nr:MULTISPECIES: hypothetical protein [Pseudoalteromonas]MCG7561633.1 hypothetical protein [Pseudoalteromonas sp. McH1-42]MEC4089295.1 hypothetical protein [Pseudoalteromonas rubra]
MTKIILSSFLLLPLLSYSKDGVVDYLEGHWECVTKTEIGEGSIMEYRTNDHYSVEQSTAKSKVTYKIYDKSQPNVASVIYIETSARFEINGDVVKSFAYKKHLSRLEKDELGIFTPQSVASFVNHSPNSVYYGKIIKIDENQFKIFDLSNEALVVPCTRVIPH